MEIRTLTNTEPFRLLVRQMNKFSHSSALSMPCFMQHSVAATTVSQVSSQLVKAETVSTAVPNWLTNPSR